ncbi:helix-turn-helix transcriptional regulator [Lacticaseibacillus manihotivorans]|uniref:HTH-type transcriptional regulator Rgg C-terminal domain-containing protein n=1 Tax=Lacticaseibacillus manihotivorans TaxID=88233 RepID=A0A5P8JTH9_9LACO|nr:helix-turn-helix transcriptional regulator [Lacticaseibacillus manihotivorans]QFQ92545.1 hypothetical protein LM010_14630 [Lacticaseibacillus manihotivorans]
MENSGNCIGSTFRNLRQRRLLEIKQVSGNLHVSTVSHFEHKDSDIRIFTLMSILRETMTDPQEFLEIVDLQAGYFETLIHRIEHAYDCLNLESLLQMRAEFPFSPLTSAPKTLINLILEVVISDVRHVSFTFSSEKLNFIIPYLLHNGPWYKLEYIVFGNVCHALPTKVNDQIVSHMLKVYDDWHLPEYTTNLVIVIFNLAGDRMNQGKLADVKQFIDILSNLSVNCEQLYLEFHISLLRLAYHVKLHPENKKSKYMLSNLLSTISMIDKSLFVKASDWLTQIDISL